MHGANRLASNSLLEAMVFGNRAAIESVQRITNSEIKNKIPNWDTKGTSEPDEMILITQSLKELQLIMSDYVGIVRTDIRLERAMRRLDLLFEETETLSENGINTMYRPAIEISVVILGPFDEIGSLAT